MTDLELLLLIIATVFGSLLSSALGWADAGGSFDIRKFLPSAVRAAISAIVVLLGLTYAFEGPITLMVYVFAFLSGMGIDAGWNRLAGAISGNRRT